LYQEIKPAQTKVLRRKKEREKERKREREKEREREKRREKRNKKEKKGEWFSRLLLEVLDFSQNIVSDAQRGKSHGLELLVRQSQQPLSVHVILLEEIHKLGNLRGNRGQPDSDIIF